MSVPYYKTWWSNYLGEKRPFHSKKVIIEPLPSATPSVTPTQTTTPTNTATPTQTNTPSITPTHNSICPEELYMTVGVSGYTDYSGTYYRLYNSSGGTFQYAYATSGAFIYDTVDGAGNYGTVWGRFDGTNYYTFLPITSVGNIVSYVGYKSSTNYATYLPTPITYSLYFRTQLEIVSNVVYPARGLGDYSSVISYPSICPVTPSPTPTHTITPSITPTKTTTPSATPAPNIFSGNVLLSNGDNNRIYILDVSGQTAYRSVQITRGYAYDIAVICDKFYNKYNGYSGDELFDVYTYTTTPFSLSYVKTITATTMDMGQAFGVCGYDNDIMLMGAQGVWSGYTTGTTMTPVKLFDYNNSGYTAGSVVYNKSDNTITASYSDDLSDGYVGKYQMDGTLLYEIQINILIYYIDNFYGLFVYQGHEYGVDSFGNAWLIDWLTGTLTQQITTFIPSGASSSFIGASDLLICDVPLTPTPTPTPSHTPTITAGEFTLSPSYTFNFTNFSGTGLPSFTLPTTGSNDTKNYSGTISAQTISVTLTGTSLSTPQLAVSLSVNNVEVDYKCITTTSSTTYSLTLPTNVSQPSTIRISVISGKSGC